MSSTEAGPRSQEPTGLPLQRSFAGLAADSEGAADQRPPLVLLHGMSFDRTMWRPALSYLRSIDPGRRVLALDLPGHGESPWRPSHRLEAVVQAVHEAVADAQLDAPIMVGHSFSGLLATVYAAQHPTRGVINVDQSLRVAPFLQLVQSLADQLRGRGFRAVWAMFEADLHVELLPEGVQDFVRATNRPRQDLILSYWQEIFERPLPELSEWLASQVLACRATGVPYWLILGDELQPGYREWLRRALPHATVKAWPRSSHFPHLAHPDRFAECLAATATWPAGLPS
ncbi:MAG TPA: alpha/beta hydrolase [Anaeromyxobacteraceae bacterium]|nr:alpha/beta hydrolase [Anaeromyxobacteraceae bacterium]